ncbi:MAG: M48 family metallopeptidase [Pseudomonadota bacterium]
MAAIGLQSHIWNNNLKSIGLLALYPIIMLVMFAAIVYMISYSGIGMPWQPGMSEQMMNSLASKRAKDIIAEFWPLIITIVGGWFMISYFFHTKMVRKMAHSHPVTRTNEPELYNMLENLCIAQGMKTPKLEIIETHARNAFASGIDDKSYTVTVTRGLIQSLSKNEVEGVLAHELAHIINRDVRLLIITIIFTSMIGFAAQMAWSTFRYSLWVPRRSSNGKGGGGIMIIIGLMIILWIGYLVTLFTRFALSRRREYMADAGAVQMTKNPEAMMRALMRIGGMERIPKLPSDIGFMCIENSVPFLGMFATHPPIQKRIEVLSQTTNTPVPDIPPKVRAPRAEAAIPPTPRSNWTTRERFKSRQNPWTRQKGSS